MNLRIRNPTLLIHLVWVYALPALLNTWLMYESEVYVNSSSGHLTWLYGALLFTIVVAFAFSLDFRSFHRANQSLILWKVPQLTMISLLAIVLFVGAMGALSGLSNWRYAAEGLSASLDPMTLLFVLAPNVLELVFFTLLFFNHDLKSRSLRVIYLLLFICLALTASGIGPMITVLLALVTAIAPLTFRRLLFKASVTNEYSMLRPILGKLFLLSPLVAILGVLAYFIGDAIKSGSSLEELIKNLGDDEMNVFLYYLLGRISVHWYSISEALHQMVELGVGDPVNNLMAPVKNAGFRLSSLFGGLLDIERPLNGSMARINYNLVTLNPFNEREGTSPGLLATFVLAFPIWLGPFALATYLWFYDKVQSGLRLRFAGSLTLFGELMLLYFTSVFFTSPVDFLLVFDPLLLFIIVLCCLGLSAKTNRIHYAAIQPSH